MLVRTAGWDCGVEARDLARGCSKAIVKWMVATLDKRWIRPSVLAVSKFLTKWPLVASEAEGRFEKQKDFREK